MAIRSFATQSISRIRPLTNRCVFPDTAAQPGMLDSQQQQHGCTASTAHPCHSNQHVFDAQRGNNKTCCCSSQSSCTHISQANRLGAFGAHFGAQKMMFSRFALKKRPAWTAQMPVLDWLFLWMEPRRLELLTPCMPCRCSLAQTHWRNMARAKVLNF